MRKTPSEKNKCRSPYLHYKTHKRQLQNFPWNWWWPTINVTTNWKKNTRVSASYKPWSQSHLCAHHNFKLVLIIHSSSTCLSITPKFYSQKAVKKDIMYYPIRTIKISISRKQCTLVFHFLKQQDSKLGEEMLFEKPWNYLLKIFEKNTFTYVYWHCRTNKQQKLRKKLVFSLARIFSNIFL